MNYKLTNVQFINPFQHTIFQNINSTFRIVAMLVISKTKQKSYRIWMYGYGLSKKRKKFICPALMIY
jgi:hypothetical protein